LLCHHVSGPLSRRTETFASCTGMIEKKIHFMWEKRINNLYSIWRNYKLKGERNTANNKTITVIMSRGNCQNVIDVNYYATKIRFDLMHPSCIEWNVPGTFQQHSGISQTISIHCDCNSHWHTRNICLPALYFAILKIQLHSHDTGDAC
jgi:hypothetical protein